MDNIEKETFAFSPMKPILLVIAGPAVYVVFSRYISSYIQYNDWVNIMVLLGLVLYLLGPLRITVLMLMMRPAVVLTDKYIKITDTGYTIYWTDVKDVYMADSGEAAVRSPQNYYVVISVREPEKYLKAIKNPVTRWYRWITRNWRETGAFEVDLSLVRGDEDEIYHRVLRYYQNNRGF